MPLINKQVAVWRSASALSALLIVALTHYPANAQRPAVAAIPAPEHLPPGASEKLRELASQRIQLFSSEGFDGNAKRYLEAHSQYARLNALVTQAEKAVRAANQNATRLAGLAVGQPDVAPQAQAAQTFAAQASDELRKRVQHRDGFANESLSPIREWAAKLEKRWSTIHGDMRALVPRDRTDPQAKTVADTLKDLTNSRTEFFEGYVLGAVASIYADDDPAEVDSLLAEGLEKVPGFLPATSLVAIDYVYACCLAQRPKRADRIIKELKEIDDKRTSIEQDWIIGLHGSTAGKLNDARKYFQLATSKMQKEVDAGSLPHPVVIADAIILFLSLENNEKRARQLFHLDPAIGNSGHWQSLRARSMLLAEDGNFQQAAALISACIARAPDSMRIDLGEQLTHYEAKQVWRKSSGR